MQRIVILALALAAACTEGDDTARLYRTQPIAPSLTAEAVEALDTLGPTVTDLGVNFSVYSERATRIDLLLFDDPEASQPTQQLQMQRFGDVWNLYVEGVGYGQHYGYIAWGPNWPWDPEWTPGTIHGFIADVDAEGNRFNPNKLLFDPYSLVLHRDHDWSKGSLASGPARATSTFAAAAKSVVVERDTYEWSAAEAEWRAARADGSARAWHQEILYEVHLKGFTASPASAVDHPGTFRGFGEHAAYLEDLGVTAVELLPVTDKPLDGGYWGYNTLHFFAPEVSYAASPDPREILDEVKEMIDVLHQHGISVILDVVYNHTGEGGFWREKIEYDDVALDPSVDAQLVNFDPQEVAGIYSYRGLDNVAYYALTADNAGYWNDTGVGNQTRTNHTPMRRLIMDSLHYWSEVMHVDGFRFDLAPILGAADGDYARWDDVRNTVLQDIIDDPVLQANRTIIIAEPWAAGGPGFRLGQFPVSSESADVAWGEWNGHFRDFWRSFVNWDDYALNRSEGVVDGGGTLTGSAALFQDDGRRPFHSTNFVTIHDGFTMYDLFSFDQKSNLCSPLNPVCCDDPTSPFCDPDSGETNNRSRNWGTNQEPFKRQLMRNLFVAMLVSHGTPMLYGGDEWLRTQLGNNNAYSTLADNPSNWFDWGVWQAYGENTRMHDFVRQMTRFRREHEYAFAPAEYGASAPFSWKSPENTDTPDWGGRSIMIHYWDDAAGPQLAILVNMDRSPVTFTLPDGPAWSMVVDTQQSFDVDGFFEGGGNDPMTSANARLDDPSPVQGQYTASGSSIVILEAAR
jgi:glycogen operon protein